MKTITSTLEDNIFSGILVKKGTNKISDKDYNILLSNSDFFGFTLLGFIRIKNFLKKEAKEAFTKSFDDMTYQELLAYIKKNNIKVPSNKKADILKVLKEG